MNSSRSISLLIFISLSSTVYADCPNCYKDQEPLTAAHGLSADGRINLLVGIAVGSTSDSWANPLGTTFPNQRLAAAAANGMGMWNKATDSDGSKTSFYFDTIGRTRAASAPRPSPSTPRA